MPAHDVPLSLEELIKLKKKGKSNDLSTTINRTKFLTKFQREKLEQEKKAKAKLEEEKAVKFANITKKITVVDDSKNDEAIQLKTDELKDSNQPTKVANKFKFDWDESEDTSKDIFYLVPKRKKNDHSLEIPSRKKVKQNESNPYNGYHWSKKPLDKMTDRDWRILKEDFDISIKGNMNEKMLRFWDEGQIPNGIVANLKQLNYIEPSPIQRAAIPMGLKGKDVIGIAETGSGKTLAFLIPALSYVINLPPVRPFESPYVLIIVPTRELAQQIEKEFQKFMVNLHFNVASIVGGHTYDENIDKLEKGVEILIGTPGRLLDVLEKKFLELNRCFFLIADEADIMIDMGFEKQFQDLLDQLPPGNENPFPIGGSEPSRTTMMFTATMPPSIEKLTSKYLNNPVTVTVGNIENAVESVVQDAIQVPNDDTKKLSVLKNILAAKNSRYSPPIIIFVNYRKTCDMLYDFLTKLNFRSEVLHGSRTQAQREEALSMMKSGQSDVLIATDVAGRGIDIPNVSLVINYQMSKSISEYVHRIGRTGRAGNRGTAITFWNADIDADVLQSLKSMIMNSSISKCPDDLRRHEYAQVKQLRNIDI